MDMIKQKPEAILILTSNCDKKPRCRHCYLPLQEKWDPKKAAETVTRLSTRGYNVTLTGGEILTDPAYLECYRLAGQKYLLSNGIALSLDQSLFRLIRKARIEEIHFSLNFGREGTLASIPEKTVMLAAIGALENNLRFQIATLITKENWNMIPGYCENAEEIGASGILFYRFLAIGYAKLGQEHVLPDALLPQFFALLKQEKARRKMPVNAAAGFAPGQRLREKLAALGKEYCPAGTRMFAITPTGKVYGCPFLISDGKEIGSLKDDGTIVVSHKISGDRSSCIAAQAALKSGL